MKVSTMKAKITENVMVDNWGDFTGIDVDLNEVFNFINEGFPELESSIHCEDYDDYGSEQYISIQGEFADMVLTKGRNLIVCSVKPGYIANESSTLTHMFVFNEGCEPKTVSIGSDYESKIREFIVNNKKYLSDSLELLHKVDLSENKPTSSGADDIASEF